MCATQSSAHTATIFLSSSLPPACLIPCYSFFPPPSLRYKVTYSSNHNFLYYQRIFKKIISNSIPTTIQTLFINQTMTDVEKLFEWTNTFIFFFIIFHAFFFASLGDELFLLLFSFFLLFFSRLFFSSFGVALFFFFLVFFSWVVAIRPSYFRCWTFLPLFLSGGEPHLFFLFWPWVFSWFLFSEGLVFCLSPSVAWTSCSEIDSSLFLAASRIVSVEPGRIIPMIRICLALAPNNHMLHIHIHEYAKCTWDVHYIYTKNIGISKFENT